MRKRGSKKTHVSVHLCKRNTERIKQKPKRLIPILWKRGGEEGMGSRHQGQGQGRISSSLGISFPTSLTLRTTVLHYIPSQTMEQVKPARMWGNPYWNGSNTRPRSHYPTEGGAGKESPKELWKEPVDWML